MNGRAFLEAARRSLEAGDEADWRTAAGRAYYALLHECDDALTRWSLARPTEEAIHRYVRLSFAMVAQADLRPIGEELESLAALRNEADYRLTRKAKFHNEKAALDAVASAAAMVDRIDAIDADDERRAAVVEAIRKTRPRPPKGLTP
jgi:uncharacterized protein (UPF0332 family)